METWKDAEIGSHQAEIGVVYAAYPKTIFATVARKLSVMAVQMMMGTFYSHVIAVKNISVQTVCQ